MIINSKTNKQNPKKGKTNQNKRKLKNIGKTKEHTQKIIIQTKLSRKRIKTPKNKTRKTKTRIEELKHKQSTHKTKTKLEEKNQKQQQVGGDRKLKMKRKI